MLLEISVIFVVITESAALFVLFFSRFKIYDHWWQVEISNTTQLVQVGNWSPSTFIANWFHFSHYFCCVCLWGAELFHIIQTRVLTVSGFVLWKWLSAIFHLHCSQWMPEPLLRTTDCVLWFRDVKFAFKFPIGGVTLHVVCFRADSSEYDLKQSWSYHEQQYQQTSRNTQFGFIKHL